MNLTEGSDYFVSSDTAFTGTAGPNATAKSIIAFRPNLFTVSTSANYVVTCV